MIKRQSPFAIEKVICEQKKKTTKNVGEVIDVSWIHAVLELEEDILGSEIQTAYLSRNKRVFFEDISPYSKRRIYKDEVPYASDETILTLRVGKERRVWNT